MYLLFVLIIFGWLPQCWLSPAWWRAELSKDLSGQPAEGPAGRAYCAHGFGEYGQLRRLGVPLVPRCSDPDPDRSMYRSI